MVTPTNQESSKHNSGGSSPRTERPPLLPPLPHIPSPALLDELQGAAITAATRAVKSQEYDLDTLSALARRVNPEFKTPENASEESPLQRLGHVLTELTHQVFLPAGRVFAVDMPPWGVAVHSGVVDEASWSNVPYLNGLTAVWQADFQISAGGETSCGVSIREYAFSDRERIASFAERNFDEIRRRGYSMNQYFEQLYFTIAARDLPRDIFVSYEVMLLRFEELSHALDYAFGALVVPEGDGPGLRLAVVRPGGSLEDSIQRAAPDYPRSIIGVVISEYSAALGSLELSMKHLLHRSQDEDALALFLAFMGQQRVRAQGQGGNVIYQAAAQTFESGLAAQGLTSPEEVLKETRYDARLALALVQSVRYADMLTDLERYERAVAVRQAR